MADLENDVVFRVMWMHGRNKEIIALWPAVDGGWPKGEFCQSYSHFGQHGAAEYSHVIRQTRPALLHEYAELLQELKDRGYKNIRVIHRAFQRHHQRRTHR